MATNPRAADDFETIRANLERVKKEREEALKNEVKTDEQIHQEVYGEFCNGNSTEHTVNILVEDANGNMVPYKTINNFYYDSLVLDEEDNIIQYEGPYFDPPDNNRMKFLPNRILP